jgi:hypothetical protein
MLAIVTADSSGLSISLQYTYPDRNGDGQSDAPELVDQYIKAFEKVWAHRKELATA